LVADSHWKSIVALPWIQLVVKPMHAVRVPIPCAQVDAMAASAQGPMQRAGS
jgi:hypothetical protein